LIRLGIFTKSRVEAIYLYLCRHGQSQYNADGKLQGQLENDLTHLGQQQATLLANKAQQWNINRIVSSPLGRAKQTAEICARILDLTVEVQSGFEERHYGEWQGCLLHQLPSFERFQQRCYSEPKFIPCDGVESTEYVRTRMAKQLRLLNQTQSQKHSTGNILLISHGDAINCLLSMWTAPLNMTNGQSVRLVETTDSYVWDKQCTAC
jgi:probable phosphoglycerate mutase